MVSKRPLQLIEGDIKSHFRSGPIFLSTYKNYSSSIRIFTL